jgi:hypothetical protein
MFCVVEAVVLDGSAPSATGLHFLPQRSYHSAVPKAVARNSPSISMAR